MWETKKELRAELENAEQRAVIHFRKLNQIESIIRIEEIKKTPSVHIVEKIKKDISSRLAIKQLIPY